MQIDIQAKGVDLTPALREYVEMRIGGLEKFLKRFDAGTILAKVEVSRTTQHHRHGSVFYAEVNLHMNGKMLRAEDTADDIRVAIDSIKDKLQREIEKLRTA